MKVHTIAAPRIIDGMIVMKTCCRCKVEKSADQFYKVAKRKDGISVYCKVCACKYASERKKTPLEIKNSLARGRRNREKHPNHTLWYDARKRAKKRGLPFSIEKNDIVIPANCPVFGKPMIAGTGRMSPSLDAIVPALGYVVGNIQVISRLANTMKNDASYEELGTFADWVRRPLDERIVALESKLSAMMNTINYQIDESIRIRLIALEKQVAAMNDFFNRGSIPNPGYEQQFRIFPGANPATNGT